MRASDRDVEVDAALRDALAPWLDVDEVGGVGLRSWLLTMLPLLPRPTGGTRVLDRDVSHAPPDERLQMLAHALADCASDRAQKNFQAAQYFQENRILVLRIKALEAAGRTRDSVRGAKEAAAEDPAADAAARRYLPRQKK